MFTYSKYTMKAIVLAAGYGTRMHPLSQHLPKPLMPVIGRPLLWHAITKLIGSKAAAVGVNCHHKSEAIRSYVRGAGFAVPLYVAHEPDILGSGGGIGGFREFLRGEEYFVVHNGDMLSDIDIEAAHAQYRRRIPLCAMVLRDAPGFNNVCVDPGGAIIDMRDLLRPAGTARRLAYTGICFLRGDMLEHIPPGASDLISILVELVRKGSEEILAIDAGPCAWRDVGTPSSYLAAHRDILVDRIPLVSPAIAPAGPVFLGAGAVPGRGAELRGFVSAGDHCRIGSRCTLENCVLWDGADVPAGSRFASAVIGPGWSVQAGGAL